MKMGECLINDQMAESLQVEEGDTVFAKMDIYQNLIALIDEFNSDISGPSGGKIKTISRDTVLPGRNS